MTLRPCLRCAEPAEEILCLACLDWLKRIIAIDRERESKLLDRERRRIGDGPPLCERCQCDLVSPESIKIGVCVKCRIRAGEIGGQS